MYLGSGGGVILSVLTALGGLLIFLVVYSSCGAFALQYFELQMSLGDAAVQDSTLESAISFFQTVYDHTYHCSLIVYVSLPF